MILQTWSDSLFTIPFERYRNVINKKNHYTVMGKVTQVIGLIIQVEGLDEFMGEK